MKNLFFKWQKALLAPALVLLFFLPNLLVGKLPISGDAILGLYHPWRDNSYLNYDIEKFPVKNPLVTDPVLQTFPWRKLVVDDYKNFKLPTWNPYNFLGQPLFANPQSTPLQIFNLLFLIFPLNFAWALLIILTSILAALFTYLFLKEQGLSSLASSYGGFVMSFSGFFVAWLTWGTVVTTAIWLPFNLYLVSKLAKKPGVVYFLLLTFSLFQSIVSGHLQTTLYVLIATSIFVIFECVKRKNLKTAFFTSFALIFALLVSAPQILSTLELVNLSNRGTDQGYWIGREDWFLPYKNLIQLIAPDFFGNPATYNYWGVWNYAEFVGYVGIIPLFFALLALLKIPKKIIFPFILAIVAILFSLNNPISRFPYIHNWSFISSLQPSRAIFLLVVSIVLISAFGFDEFRKKDFTKKLVLPLIVIIVCLSLSFFFSNQILEGANSQVATNNLKLPFLIWIFLVFMVILKFLKVKGTSIVILIFLFTVFELFRFAYKFTPFTKEEAIFPETKILSYLKLQEKPFRVLSTDRRIMSPNALAFYSIESISGYDPLYLKNFAHFTDAWQSKKINKDVSFNRIITPQNFQNEITNILNIKFILTFDQINNSQFEMIMEEGKTKLYENKEVKSRLFFPDEVIKSSELESLQNLTSDNYNFSKIAFSKVDLAKDETKKNASIEEYREDYIRARTQTEAESLIIFSSVHFPGWKTYIDGEGSENLKTNYLLQSALVPKGDHTIEFRYEPDTLRKGFYVSAIGLMLTFVFSYSLWKKKYLL